MKYKVGDRFRNGGLAELIVTAVSAGSTPVDNTYQINTKDHVYDNWYYERGVDYLVSLGLWKLSRTTKLLRFKRCP